MTASRARRFRVAAALTAVVSAMGGVAGAADGTAPARVDGVGADAGGEDEVGDAADGTAQGDRPVLSDRAELDRIIELYMSGDYSGCSRELQRLLNVKSPRHFSERSIIEKGRLYYASCALLDGKRSDARRALKDALEENPLMPSPDSLTFPPPVVGLFLEVRDEVQQLIADREKEQLIRLRRENELARRRAAQREYREQLLEKMAREETVVRRNSRALASIPFGVGQYQNGSPVLGSAFLVSEVLLLATAVTSGLILADLTERASGGQLSEPERYNRQKHAAHNTLTFSSWAFLGVAGLGILDAQLRFKPETKLATRERPLPPEIEDIPDEVPDKEGRNELSVAPTLQVGPGGASFGLVGTF